MELNMEKFLTGLDEKKANLILLILSSQHIETRVDRQNRRLDIHVHKAEINAARKAIDAYYTENRFLDFKQQIEDFPLSSFNSLPAFFIMGLLMAIHVACLHYHIHEDMVLKYGASALYILQGETYRAVTALFLHADARHLVGNLAGLLIFGAPFISLSGFGTGPFMLLFTGTLGNLITARLYQSAHLSIGSSTAIMGAAGLLVAYQVTGKGRSFQLNTLMPIFAGALLVGMFSQGESTDVWAHVLGFGCGLFSGLVFCPLNRTLQFPQKNTLALFISLFILCAAIWSGV